MNQPWKKENLTKSKWLVREVAKAVNAGKAWDVETVDFSDPNRELTCIEVDFPIVPINDIAIIEGKGSGALKPIYQTMKWWARRRSVVFRSMLLATAIKAPDDASEAAKLLWDVYYGNHQKKGIFKHLKVVDIFMGGGTTIVEGCRLGMAMYGYDLNPVAWFVVKNEMAHVHKSEIETILKQIELEVKPQLMPFYTCQCPRGHNGKWSQLSTGQLMDNDFDPLSLTPEQRKDYSYVGPEVVYTFWAKHGVCHSTGCGHRTPIMSNSVMASKTVTIKAWKRKCKHCGEHYDIEGRDTRMAPGIPLHVAGTERPYATARLNLNDLPVSAVCPHCETEEEFGSLGKPHNKSIALSLLVDPKWLSGEAAKDRNGDVFGGSSEHEAEATVRWNKARASSCQLIEVRGSLDSSGLDTKGTVSAKSTFSCGSCGTAWDIRESVTRFGMTAPVAMYGIQGYCPECADEGDGLGGRFYIPASDSLQYDAAIREWEARKCADLSGYWPTSEVPDGLKVRELHNYKYSHWWKMFNSRQLLLLSALLKSIAQHIDCDAGEAVLGAFQQYLRNQNMFCFWNMQRALEPFFSNHNYHPKPTTVENSAFTSLARGDWLACSRFILESNDWGENPWEIVGNHSSLAPEVAANIATSSIKVGTKDPLFSIIRDKSSNSSVSLDCRSSTELPHESNTIDAVVTDPPFGGNIQYSELSEFFYAWMRLVLCRKYPKQFSDISPPKALEAVANSARHGSGDIHYQRLLTACYSEAFRILKPGGTLAFTFHHSEDAAWVAVLESLFEAGFFLAATYPIRSDETKGDKAQFGSQKIEYDIIHVCRKRQQEPKAISWARLRRHVLQDVRALQELLEHHQQEGLPEADLQVIRRGKALEYFSRHYGKVYKDQETPMSVLEALLGINQLLDEEASGIKESPPHNAEPFTRMLLRLFDGNAELPRDQIQKFLRGTGSAPSDFVNRGWVTERKKVFHLVPPLEVAESWVGKQRKGMTSDYDQAMFFIGACFENSGINASETLNNPNFLPHPALGGLLTWFKTHGANSPTRNAASTASQLYRSWEAKNQPKMAQLSLFDILGEDD